MRATSVIVLITLAIFIPLVSAATSDSSLNSGQINKALMEQIASRNLGKSSRDAQKQVDRINREEAIAKKKAAAEAKAKAEAARIEAERVAAEQAAAVEAARQAEIARQAELDRQAAYVAPAPQKAASSYAPGDNEAMNYIFMKESGNNPAARNAGGCLGLGQACPGQKLINACPDYANDIPCQIAFFTAYANGRYGGWGGAYQFWIQNHWW